MDEGRPILQTAWLGRVPYKPAYRLQQSLVERRKANDVPDTLLLLEHDHVFTLGRRADDTHVLSETSAISGLGAEVVDTDRGGEATYHGPGQLVAYPIVSIRELKMGPVAYVRILEETVIQVLKEYGVSGHRVVGKTGVWVDGEPGNRPSDGTNPSGRKIAAIGVRVSGGVAMHGMALNVGTDLRYYDQIVPCGMPNLDVTSMAREPGTIETGSPLEAEAVARVWADIFADILFFDLQWNPSGVVPDFQSASALVSV